MREIKFRGRRTYNNKWVYGYIWIVPGVNLNYILTGKISITDFTVEKYEVIPDTVGQYTGLKDSNGREIYEGDILGSSNMPIGKIIWNQDEAGYRLVRRSHKNGVDDFKYFVNASPGLKNMEVLGNVFDNLELLKKEKVK